MFPGAPTWYVPWRRSVAGPSGVNGLLDGFLGPFPSGVASGELLQPALGAHGARIFLSSCTAPGAPIRSLMEALLVG
jgi:hypothetical protein